MIDEELKKIYNALIRGCIEENALFMENYECGLAKKVTDIYLVDCPKRKGFKCLAYRKQDKV
ncbi:MAG: hypothetical protein ACPLXC_00050 [Candidatus Pacearchaeota archaeon]